MKLRRILLLTAVAALSSGAFAQTPACPAANYPCGPAVLVSGPGPSADVACKNTNAQKCVNIYVEDKLVKLTEVTPGSSGKIELLGQDGRPMQSLTFTTFVGYKDNAEGATVISMRGVR